MSEEEKKAIEWLKNATFFSARLYAPTILKLIDKQQKEIEELKENQIWSEATIEGLKTDFIHKDKIRKKNKRNRKC